MIEKLRQYERVFNHFDVNNDGRISSSELRQCAKAIGRELSEEEAEVAVECLDADGDGLVGLDDFVRFVEGGEEEERVNDLKEAFRMYEMDGCGCITPKSLKRMLSKLVKVLIRRILSSIRALAVLVLSVSQTLPSPSDHWVCLKGSDQIELQAKRQRKHSYQHRREPNNPSRQILKLWLQVRKQ
ncbi:hypothetical protein L6164_009032 [Bauhinia variegata]|uniref:Uncharacterized protein n=1 Tax=Bauhinia variegata TaxID=167791 RepID=A0ACB9PIL0_BAUVA|nr:hypothetical protein L6164_009032 [Bauhinia variegata]